MTNNCSGDCGKDSMVVNTSGFNDTAFCERYAKPTEAAMPPLPDPIILPSRSVTGASVPSHWDAVEPRTVSSTVRGPEFVDTGCYYIRLTPTSLQAAARYQLEGTLRVSRIGAAFSASGDLYKSDVCSDPIYCPSLTGDQSGAAGIPVFPRKHYGYYLRVNGVPYNNQDDCGGSMNMEMFRFDQSNQSWGPAEAVTVDLRLSTGVDGVHYWQGDLKTVAGVLKGSFLMVRISSNLRQAVVEIDCIKGSHPPVMEPDSDKPGEKWREVFQKAGWDISVRLSNMDIDKPADHGWSNGELHETMLEYRDEHRLDKEWRFHLLAVKELYDEAFGVMYDNTIKGVNDIPREGAAVASHVTFSDDPRWGNYKNDPFYTCKEAYVRTAIHEIGHAMMLYHPDNPYENHIMQRTENLAFYSSSRVSFPGCIEWSFSPRDIHMLSHLPDIAIRPGGICFGTPHERIPLNVRDEVMEADGLKLEIEPLSPVLPIGAPMRIKYTLKNDSNTDQVAPGSIRMKSGHISGKVIDPLGAAQDFATIVIYTSNDATEKENTQILEKGKSISHSATLLWGAEGPLCPTSGYYRVIVQLDWHAAGVRRRISGHTDLMVTPPENAEHAKAALKIFTTPKTILSLAVGGTHITEGNEAIDEAMKNPILKPHFALIQAKGHSLRHFEKMPNLKEASEVLNEKSEISATELVKLAKIVTDWASQTTKEVLQKLEAFIVFKVEKLEIEPEDKKMVISAVKEIQKKQQAKEA